MLQTDPFRWIRTSRWYDSGIHICFTLSNCNSKAAFYLFMPVMALKPDAVEIGSGCDLVLQVEEYHRKRYIGSGEFEDK